jgi:hypothetical protein
MSSRQQADHNTGPLPYNDLHDLLPRLPNVQVLFLHSATFPQTFTRTITHQKLCKLEVDTSQDDQLLFPIFYVILPGLKSLSLLNHAL